MSTTSSAPSAKVTRSAGRGPPPSPPRSPPPCGLGAPGRIPATAGAGSQRGSGARACLIAATWPCVSHLRARFLAGTAGRADLAIGSPCGPARGLDRGAPLGLGREPEDEVHPRPDLPTRSPPPLARTVFASTEEGADAASGRSTGSLPSSRWTCGCCCRKPRASWKTKDGRTGSGGSGRSTSGLMYLGSLPGSRVSGGRARVPGGLELGLEPPQEPVALQVPGVREAGEEPVLREERDAVGFAQRAAERARADPQRAGAAGERGGGRVAGAEAAGAEADEEARGAVRGAGHVQGRRAPRLQDAAGEDAPGLATPQALGSRPASAGRLRPRARRKTRSAPRASSAGCASAPAGALPRGPAQGSGLTGRGGSRARAASVAPRATSQTTRPSSSRARLTGRGRLLLDTGAQSTQIGGSGTRADQGTAEGRNLPVSKDALSHRIAFYTGGSSGLTLRNM
jgi:hypothetical protein